jgi:hypothetical protein
LRVAVGAAERSEDRKQEAEHHAILAGVIAIVSGESARRWR